MAKMPAHLRFTYEDYKSLPDCEGKHYELLDGELLLTPSPTWKHQQISGRLEFVLTAFVTQHQLGDVAHAPLDVLLGEDVAQPDILFISHERADIIHDEAVRGAPDLTIEILSPSTADRDLGYKRKIYETHGVKEYWIVDPDLQTIEVILFETAASTTFQEKDQLTSPTLDGLSVSLQEIFK